MLICASCGSSPTCRRHSVLPVFQPLIPGLSPSRGFPEVVCLPHNSFKLRLGNGLRKDAQHECSWTLSSPSCASFTLSPDQHRAHKSSLGHAARLYGGIWALLCSSAVLGRQRPWLANEKRFSSGGLLFLVSRTLRRKVAENQLSCQKGQKSFLRAARLFYLFILLIYHTLVTSLIFLNLTNRLPRT